MTAELAFERSGPERIYSSVVVLEEWLRALHAAKRVGEKASRTERSAFGALIKELATLRALSLSITGRLDQVWRTGISPKAGSCVLTGLRIYPGDCAYRPRACKTYAPANRDRMMLAAAVNDDQRIRT